MSWLGLRCRVVHSHQYVAQPHHHSHGHGSRVFRYRLILIYATSQIRAIFNGVLQQVFGFTGTEATGAPREIIPQVGDTFTILDRWMDLDSEGNVTQVIQQEGETLTFGSQTFTWKELYAPAGQFVIGYIVEDLDGQGKTTVAPITVR